ncbi:MAG: alpha/beta hydrolase [Rhodanobacteraceae bacterium]|jgi:predicted alpha/beta hydrolase|nr:alpha/beta hydrolase [Rhodanobacteraceae bacterium]
MSEARSGDAGAAMIESLRVTAADGAGADLQCVYPDGPVHDVVLWLPALGVSARKYLPLATALAGRGIAVALHEWRGLGSSDRRAGFRCDWGYRELLLQDLPASLAAVRAACPQARIWFGGHSLGGQLAMLFAALQAAPPAGLLLVGSGAPYWRVFSRRWLIGAALVLVPAIARLCGHLPGRRLGFGGREARSVMADWARSGRSGRYAAAGLAVDLEAACARLRLPVLALRLRDDWLGPAAALAWLLGKMPQAAADVRVLGPDVLGTAADHFGWMQAPHAVAAALAAGIDAKTAK